MSAQAQTSSQAITAFDKTNLPMLRSEINAALASIGAKYGISLQAGNASFKSDVATFKLMVAVGNKTTADVRDDKMAEALKLYWPSIRDTNQSIDDTFMMSNMKFKVVGYNTRGRTAPVIVQDIKNGKQYKITVAQLRNSVVVK